MSAVAKILPTCILGVTLSGCAGHTHQLESVNESSPVTGSFSHDGTQVPVMVLELEGARYEGRGFEIRRHQDLAEMRKLYGPGKHYDRIASGVDRDHLRSSASPVLRAPNGETIRCLLTWGPGQDPAGVCTKSDGKQIAVRFD
ncbi:hypothetical protein CAP2UW1_4677 (plasmid) [Candidatus Accumulibacter phosphatis clade IIA str. UW-1]|jgi:hypothetical protein|uniref:Lipoprotein n=1 Tax=Accumulibacter regalis TaxID=522306 RepID=C7RVZ2_ACCRE